VLTLSAVVSAERVHEACGATPGFLCRKTLELTGDRTLAEAIDFIIGKPLAIIAIVLAAAFVARILRRGVKRALRTMQSGAVQERLGAVRRMTPDALLETREISLRAEQRIEALASVLGSVATFVVWAIASFMVLGQLGIELGPLIAGAGILGVAIGFGSQALVRDFLSGVFILIEDQFGVGDIVDIDGQTSGTVEAVSLRMTRLRSVDGTLWHVPNGEIRRVGNMSQHWSRALLDMQVAYDTDLDRAHAVIGETARAQWDADDAILEEPEVWGVEAFGAHGMTIRLVVKTTPSEQYRVSRELRARLKAAFDAADIEIPFPQQTVWHRSDPRQPA
jgi:moderate conductance mechanosensitive channel